MSDEGFDELQRVCNEVNELLRANYPSDLRERCAALGMALAATIYLICTENEGARPGVIIGHSTRYVADMLQMMMDNPEMVRTHATELH